MPTMRPKKTRYFEDVELEDYLYLDPKKRHGYWRYKRPDGSFKTFNTISIEDANRMAKEANSLRDSDIPINKKIPLRDQLAYHVPLYFLYRERLNPDLNKKRSWDNRKYALTQLAETFPRIGQINMDLIRLWWDELTYHQQKLRMAEFRRFFNWVMGQGLLPKVKFNPFTTSDDVARLLPKEKPKKMRRPCTQEYYRQIYIKAGEMDYECLQIAMAISRYTTLREGDICSIMWDKNIIDGELRIVVSKSQAQKGEARASRLSWKLSDHPVLKKIIDRARELRLINRNCPYVVSHKPKRRVWNEEKTHLHQVTPDRLSRMFNEVMKACEIAGTSFHEIRGLSSTLLKSAGYTNQQIQELMAHEDINTTIGYQNADELPYQKVDLVLGE